MSETPTEGVWITPAGTRVEIIREGDRWRAYPYMSRRGGIPGDVYEYDTAEQVRGLVDQLQSGGHVWVPGASADGPPGPGDRMARNMIGLVLLVLVIVIGVAIAAA